MVGRVKFQVWGKYGWRTAYCKNDMLLANLRLFKAYGITVCVGGRPTEVAA